MKASCKKILFVECAILFVGQAAAGKSFRIAAPPADLETHGSSLRVQNSDVCKAVLEAHKIMQTMRDVLEKPVVGHMTVKDIADKVVDAVDQKYLSYGWEAFNYILNPEYICSNFDRIVLWEGNKCSQDNLGTVGLNQDLNFKKNCLPNDEARSMLITGKLCMLDLAKTAQ